MTMVKPRLSLTDCLETSSKIFQNDRLKAFEANTHRVTHSFVISFVKMSSHDVLFSNTFENTYCSCLSEKISDNVQCRLCVVSVLTKNYVHTHTQTRTFEVEQRVARRPWTRTIEIQCESKHTFSLRIALLALLFVVGQLFLLVR